MKDEAEIVYNKSTKRVYFGSEFKVAHIPSGKVRSMRYVSRVYEVADRPQFVKVEGGEAVIRTTRSGRQQVKARFFVDTRGIAALILQRFSVGADTPHEETSFTLMGSEIQSLLDIALLIKTGQFTDSNKVRVDTEDLQNFAITPTAARSLLKADPNLLTELLRHEITEKDVVSIAYRRHQLERFRKLLSDDEFFAREKESAKTKRDEDVWQRFFEQNHWIFGYGLFLVATSALVDEKLEQYVAGASVASAGKRVDALLRTQGLASSLCFAEIKTHRTPLLSRSAHRSDAWAPSRELAEAVSQAQTTVDHAERSLAKRVEPRDDEGNPTGVSAYLMRPRSVVVVGSLSEFQADHGLNEPRFTSFELFRRQLVSPEVITFDELYARASFIVEQAESP